MTTDAPQFVIPVESCGTVTQVRGADDVVHAATGALERSTDWRSRPGDAGLALVELFGRMSELIITRLNQTPDKHFLTFLNEAGIDLLPPRPASTELTFTLAKDIATPVKVPAGTQVATKQTETQPEVIFETQRDLIVSPNALVKVVAFDPVTSSDRTAQALGQAGDASFAAFQGEGERERVLDLGDADLFNFSDATSRDAARVTLTFEFASPGIPSADGGWKIEWSGWNGTKWANLAEGAAGVVTDGTSGFSKDGAIVFEHLPEMAETAVNGATGRWLACKLTGGTGREHLPVIKRIRGGREIKDLAGASRGRRGVQRGPGRRGVRAAQHRRRLPAPRPAAHAPRCLLSGLAGSVLQARRDGQDRADRPDRCAGGSNQRRSLGPDGRLGILQH